MIKNVFKKVYVFNNLNLSSALEYTGNMRNRKYIIDFLFIITALLGNLYPVTPSSLFDWCNSLDDSVNYTFHDLVCFSTFSIKSRLF